MKNIEEKYMNPIEENKLQISKGDDATDIISCIMVEFHNSIDMEIRLNILYTLRLGMYFNKFTAPITQNISVPIYESRRRK